jgi:hypothetical protein
MSARSPPLAPRLAPRGRTLASNLFKTPTFNPMHKSPTCAWARGLLPAGPLARPHKRRHNKNHLISVTINPTHKSPTCPRARGLLTRSWTRAHQDPQKTQYGPKVQHFSAANTMSVTQPKSVGIRTTSFGYGPRYLGRTVAHISSLRRRRLIRQVFVPTPNYSTRTSSFRLPNAEAYSHE